MGRAQHVGGSYIGEPPVVDNRGPLPVESIWCEQQLGGEQVGSLAQGIEVSHRWAPR